MWIALPCPQQQCGTVVGFATKTLVLPDCFAWCQSMSPQLVSTASCSLWCLASTKVCFQDFLGSSTCQLFWRRCSPKVRTFNGSSDPVWYCHRMMALAVYIQWFWEGQAVDMFFQRTDIFISTWQFLAIRKQAEKSPSFIFSFVNWVDTAEGHKILNSTEQFGKWHSWCLFFLQLDRWILLRRPLHSKGLQSSKTSEGLKIFCQKQKENQFQQIQLLPSYQVMVLNVNECFEFMSSINRCNY